MLCQPCLYWTGGAETPVSANPKPTLKDALSFLWRNPQVSFGQVESECTISYLFLIINAVFNLWLYSHTDWRDEKIKIWWKSEHQYPQNGREPTFQDSLQQGTTVLFLFSYIYIYPYTQFLHRHIYIHTHIYKKHVNESRGNAIKLVPDRMSSLRTSFKSEFSAFRSRAERYKKARPLLRAKQRKLT